MSTSRSPVRIRNGRSPYAAPGVPLDDGSTAPSRDGRAQRRAARHRHVDPVVEALLPGAARVVVVVRRDRAAVADHHPVPAANHGDACRALSSLKNRQRGSAYSVGVGRRAWSFRPAAARRPSARARPGDDEVLADTEGTARRRRRAAALAQPARTPQAATSSSTRQPSAAWVDCWTVAATLRTRPEAPTCELHDLTALEQGAADPGRGDLDRRAGGALPRRIDRHSASSAPSSRVTAEQAGRAPPVGDGPLAGVPTAIKDLNATEGVLTSFGSPAFADFVPYFDDEVVRRIAAAGMVSLGKTSTPEFGSPCYTEPEGLPPAVTPWDTTRMAGGSSGGAAAAVAGRAGPGRPGLRRRRLDPDPGELLRAGRAEADPGPDLRRPDVRRPGRPRHQRPARPHRARRRGDARRDGRPRRRRPVLGTRGGAAVPRRLRPRARAAADRPLQRAGHRRRRRGPRVPGRLGGRRAGCSRRSGTRSSTSRCRCRARRCRSSRPAGPCSPRCRW